MPERRLEIRMAPETVSTLQRSGFVLYVFRAVRTSNPSARPLIWRKRDRYSARTVLRWGAELRAFTSFDGILPGKEIFPGFDLPMAPGRTLRIGPGGIGEVVDDPGVLPTNRRSSYGFHQTDSISIRCGLATPGQDRAEPFCAFELLPGFAEVVTRTEKVLSIFSSHELDPGTVVETLFDPGEAPGSGSGSVRSGVGPGLLLDLENRDQQVARFDTESGWHSDDPDARPVAATENLVPLLVEKPARGAGQRGGREPCP